MEVILHLSRSLKLETVSFNLVYLHLFEVMCQKCIPNQALIHVMISDYYLYLTPPSLLFPINVGMFFQWILCGGALLVGIIVQVIRGTNHFYPLVMLGGLIWETGRSVQKCFFYKHL